MGNRATLLVAVGCLIAASCGGEESRDTSPAETSVAASATTTTVLPSTTAASTGPQAAAGSGCDVLHEPGEYEGMGHYGDVEQP